jgi:hypothetical protein
VITGKPGHGDLRNFPQPEGAGKRTGSSGNSTLAVKSKP